MQKMIRTEIMEEIKRQCGNARMLNDGWCHFVYRHVHYVSKLSGDMIRFTIPYVTDNANYARDLLDAAVNETNREVKFVKAMTLNNGCISLNYDHRTCNDEKVDEIVAHMIKALYAASEYLMLKLRAML